MKLQIGMSFEVVEALCNFRDSTKGRWYTCNKYGWFIDDSGVYDGGAYLKGAPDNEIKPVGRLTVTKLK